MGQPYDIVIVGTGAAGLTAAAVAASEGLKILVIEKQASVGGTTMLSGGTVWVPNNSIAKESGIIDTKDNASRYLEAAIHSEENDGLDFMRSMWKEYLDEAPNMINFLQKKGFKWRPSMFPDYQPLLAGALPEGGRTLNPDLFNLENLGTWKRNIEPTSAYNRVSTFEGLRNLTRPGTLSPQSQEENRDVDPANGMNERVVSMGRSLIGQLLLICKSYGVEIRTKTRFTNLQVSAEGDEVVGVDIDTSGEKIPCHAVFLGVAGFVRNQRMREEFLHKLTMVNWTLTQQGGDEGEVLRMLKSLGVKCALLQETWGIPVMEDPSISAMVPAMFEISKPHSIVVDQKGRRFCNEAKPYGDYVHSVYERDVGCRIPAWLVLDSAYLDVYTLGSLFPGQKNQLEEAVKTGRLIRSFSLFDLAKQLTNQPENLMKTIEEWNEMCTKGLDTIFGRGNDEYQRFIGDASVQPNPNMGDIATAPFYAVRIFPGDAGNKGGIVTDGKGRVLREQGDILRGLYASGNVTASPFGKASIAAGATLGPAMTFAYTAMKDVCKYLKVRATGPI
jgi:hypothetical protein